MAFNVTLYMFSKKQNSTAVPSAAGTTYSCTAKQPLDIIAPTIQLQLSGGASAIPVGYNYAYIGSFARYYWVRSWRNVGPLWEAELTCDVLASWRTAIGSQSCYVYRSAYSYDLRLPDNMYPTKTDPRILNISLPKMWTIGGASASGAANNSGYFVAGIISTGGTTYYAFTAESWSLFLYKLCSDDYYEDVLTVFGAAAYPEAKVAVNPMQYISFVKWCPIGLGSSGSWCLHYSSTTTTIPVGVTSVTLSGTQTYVAYVLPDNPTVTSIEDVDTEAADFEHPQADDRGTWTNYSPYTSVELFYPPLGLISLDPVMIAKYRYLRISLTLDARTCTCMLDVYCHDNNTHRVIFRGTGSFGVDVPVSTIVQPGSSPMSYLSSALGVIGGIANMSMGNIVGGASQMLGGAASAIGSAVSGQIPHLSTIGGPGSTSSLYGAPRLYVTQWYLSDDDLADKGRPLCSTRQISAIPGYIKCDSDHVDIACMSQELGEIRSIMENGFYYE